MGMKSSDIISSTDWPLAARNRAVWLVNTDQTHREPLVASEVELDQPSFWLVVGATMAASTLFAVAMFTWRAIAFGI